MNPIPADIDQIFADLDISNNNDFSRILVGMGLGRDNPSRDDLARLTCVFLKDLSKDIEKNKEEMGDEKEKELSEKDEKIEKLEKKIEDLEEKVMDLESCLISGKEEREEMIKGYNEDQEKIKELTKYIEELEDKQVAKCNQKEVSAMEKQIFVKDITGNRDNIRPVEPEVQATVDVVIPSEPIEPEAVPVIVAEPPVASNPIEPKVDRIKIDTLKEKVFGLLSVTTPTATVSLLSLLGVLKNSIGLAALKESTLRYALKQLIIEGKVATVGGKKNRTYYTNVSVMIE